MQILLLSILIPFLLSILIRRYFGKKDKKFTLILLSILLIYTAVLIFLKFYFKWNFYPLHNIILNIFLLLFFIILGIVKKLIPVVIIILLIALISVYTLADKILENLTGQKVTGTAQILKIKDKKILILSNDDHFKREDITGFKRWGISGYTLHFKKFMYITGFTTRYRITSIVCQNEENQIKTFPLLPGIDNNFLWEFLEKNEKKIPFIDTVQQEIILKLVKTGKYNIMVDNSGGLLIKYLN
ncbi:MAG: hypothetical protein KAS39_06805 [Actinomycetia bacterium]|nr:hypothetical protein [Actinomycetes bacterium]